MAKKKKETEVVVATGPTSDTIKDPNVDVGEGTTFESGDTTGGGSITTGTVSADVFGEDIKPQLELVVDFEAMAYLLGLKPTEAKVQSCFMTIQGVHIVLHQEDVDKYPDGTAMAIKTVKLLHQQDGPYVQVEVTEHEPEPAAK